jgi:hypothetical protein
MSESENRSNITQENGWLLAKYYKLLEKMSIDVNKIMERNLKYGGF